MPAGSGRLCLPFGFGAFLFEGIHELALGLRNIVMLEVLISGRAILLIVFGHWVSPPFGELDYPSSLIMGLVLLVGSGSLCFSFVFGLAVSHGFERIHELALGLRDSVSRPCQIPVSDGLVFFIFEHRFRLRGYEGGVRRSVTRGFGLAGGGEQPLPLFRLELGRPAWL